MDFPVEFTERIKEQAGINAEDLLKSLKEPSPVSVRINNAKWNREPYRGKGIPWCSEGWYLEKRPSYTLDPLFHAGCYYPQEASGMFVGEAFRQIRDDRSGIRVLDLCGAPGGKSTHLSSLIGNKGILVSNEVIRSRALLLAGNITRWGIANTLVTSSDPASFSGLVDYFDIILADVPCSGEGMFRDEIAVREWSVANIVLCSERQKRIVIDVWPSLRNGGFLIYSTCTFNPAENEENIRWLINNCQCESVRLDISRFGGIHTIEHKGVTGYAFYPGKTEGEGFFLSVVRKTGESRDSEEIRQGNGPGSVFKEERKAVRHLVKYEVPLMLRDKEDIIAVPLKADEFFPLSQRLNLIKKGTSVCKLKRKDIVPSHELVLSELMAVGVFPTVDLEYSDAVRFLRKENLQITSMPDGWIIVRYRGVNIGWIKDIGRRINNYFPVNWRIRMQAEADVNEIISWKE